MNAAIIAAVYFGCTLIAPAYSINCTTCNNCSAPNAFVSVTQCVQGDVCVKIDPNNDGIFKQCGNHAQLCNADGFKTNWANLYADLKKAFGQIYVDGALLINLNDRGRHFINCCSDRDNCNSALSLSLSLAVAFGMMLTLYVLI